MTAKLRMGVLGRFSFVALILVIAFGLMLAHACDVQVKKHGSYETKSNALCRRSQGEAAQRGCIWDFNGNLFAGNIATRNIYVEPKRFAGRLDEVTQLMATQLGMDYHALHRNLLRAVNYTFPARVASGITMQEISAKGLAGIPGVRFHQEKKVAECLPGEQPTFTVYLQFAWNPVPEEPSGKPAAGKKGRRAKVKRISPEISRSCHKLAKALDLEADDLISSCSRAQDRCKEVILKWNASREEADALLNALKEIKITSGVRVTDSWIRDYPRSAFFANMLGYVNDDHGVSGIEMLMDDYLQPTAGRYTYLRDRYGVMINDEVTYEVKPKNGADVYLTIQEPIQQIVEEELGALYEKYAPVHAYAILMNPSTGAILALAQYPQFDPNNRMSIEGKGENAQNYCLTQCYEPGSIMKPISLSGVLENHAARLDTVVDCEHGYWRYGGAPLRDSHQFDNLSLSEVIKKSSNIGTAKLALEIGDEKMFQHLSAFAFGRRTGLGFYPEEGAPTFFRHEARGFFTPLRQWKPISITRMSIGQSINVTPLQIVQAWGALANNGLMMQPYIIDRVEYPDGRTIYSRPRVKAQPITAETANRIRQALKTVTEEGGTGARAAIKGFSVAGKTGTAQICQPANPEKGILKAGYNNHDYFASFIGYVPADNPQFLLLVSAEQPTKVAHTGAGVSAPTFKRIAQRTLEYLQIDPEMPEEPVTANRTAMR